MCQARSVRYFPCSVAPACTCLTSILPILRQQSSPHCEHRQWLLPDTLICSASATHSIPSSHAHLLPLCTSSPFYMFLALVKVSDPTAHDDTSVDWKSPHNDHGHTRHRRFIRHHDNHGQLHDESTLGLSNSAPSVVSTRNQALTIVAVTWLTAVGVVQAWPGAILPTRRLNGPCA